MDTNQICQSCGVALAADAPRGLCPACLMKVAMDTGTTLPGESRGFNPPTVAELAVLFPQLEIIEFIGRGGMGAVYKARQKELDRVVALKILPPGIGTDPAFAERFAREAKALARLNHPGIVTIHDFGKADSLYFFVMEYVDGVNLRQLLQASRVEPREALAIVPQICDALQFAHDQGIVHRDIKPENILLDRRGRVKVADFGLAKIMEGNAPLTPSLSPSDGERVAKPGEGSPALTDAGKVMGTPQYMSPEQIEAPGEVDHRADIYALGVVFYQMLTGELPGSKIEPPSKKVSIDVRLDEVVLRALEQKPELRYQQASVLKTQVESIASSPEAGSGPHKEVQTDKSEIESRFSRLAVVGACWAGVAFLAVLGAIMLANIGVRLTFGEPLWWQMIYILFVVPLTLIAVTAPFGTTLLGWIAVSQIRRAAGRLYGVRLAVFDGLLFPLLALDALIVGGFWLGVRFYLVNTSAGYSAEFLPRVAYWLLILAAIFAGLIIDYFIIRRVWRAVKLPDGAGAELEERWHSKDQSGRLWKYAAWVVFFLLIAAVFGQVVWILTGRHFGQPNTAAAVRLAEMPHELRKLSTDKLIAIALVVPNKTPWPWNELERRPLTTNEVNRIMDGLTAWLKREHPEGMTQPLSWLDSFLDGLDRRNMVSTEQAVAFAEVLHGPVRCDQRLRMREGTRALSLSGKLRHIWSDQALGLDLMNEVEGVTIDGQPAKWLQAPQKLWNWNDFNCSVDVSDVAPGKHTVKVEVLSALVPSSDARGMSFNAPASDWPPAKKRWTRTAEMELTVYSRDAEMVSQTLDPALDPAKADALSVKPIRIYSRGDESRALLYFEVHKQLPVPVSFDVELRVAGQSFQKGSVESYKRADGIIQPSRFSMEIDIPALAPDVTEAEILLTPNPKWLETVSAVDQIWGGRVTLSKVPLKRLDMRGQLSAEEE